MPYYPRADRPELLTYKLSAIIHLLSKTYYGPQILVNFCTRLLFLTRRFLTVSNVLAPNWRILAFEKRLYDTERS